MFLGGKVMCVVVLFADPWWNQLKSQCFFVIYIDVILTLVES